MLPPIPAGEGEQPARGCLIEVLRRQRLEPYKLLCVVPKEPFGPGGLPTWISRRVQWLQRELDDFGASFQGVFPTAWEVPVHLCHEFCLLTREFFTKLLIHISHVAPENQVPSGFAPILGLDQLLRRARSAHPFLDKIPLQHLNLVDVAVEPTDITQSMNLLLNLEVKLDAGCSPTDPILFSPPLRLRLASADAPSSELSPNDSFGPRSELLFHEPPSRPYFPAFKGCLSSLLVPCLLPYIEFMLDDALEFLASLNFSVSGEPSSVSCLQYDEVKILTLKILHGCNHFAKYSRGPMLILLARGYAGSVQEMAELIHRKFPFGRKSKSHSIHTHAQK